MSTTTDIIPGMTEVMNYIKKQEEEIKNLEDKIGRYDKSRDAWMVTADERHREITKLKKEKESLTFIMKGQDDVRRECIKGYTEQIEKLKEQIERDSGCEENAKLRKENEKLYEKYGKLLKEYEELHEDCCSRMNKEQEAEVMKENKKLKEEIEELKEHLECEEDGYPTSDWFVDKLDFHIKYHFLNEGGEYYEALKDLKEKPNCLDDLIYGSLERLQEEIKEKEETFKYQSDMEKQCHNDDIDKKQQVIDELKEEIEELKTSIQTTTSYWTDKNELLQEDIKKLQEFCKRGRVAKKDSPLEEMFLREAGLMYHDDGETLVSSKKPQID